MGDPRPIYRVVSVNADDIPLFEPVAVAECCAVFGRLFTKVTIGHFEMLGRVEISEYDGIGTGIIGVGGEEEFGYALMNWHARQGIWRVVNVRVFHLDQLKLFQNQVEILFSMRASMARMLMPTPPRCRTP